MTVLATTRTDRTLPIAGDRQVWNRAQLITRRSWRSTIPTSVTAEFLRFCAGETRVADDSDDFADFSGAENPLATSLPHMARFAARIRENIINGDGLAWIRGLHDLALSRTHQRLFYVAFGAALGRPMTQYGVLYPVVDRGIDFTTTALPVSMTNAETAFHSDSSSRHALPDLVGLLCENPSDDGGGESLVSNALQAYGQLQRSRPEVLEVLHRDFIRDVVTPGTEKTRQNLLRNRFPVFTRSKRRDGHEELLFRYMRYWIERGQHRAGSPLDASAIAALDALDDRLRDPANVMSFALAKGDMLWVNNRTIAHNRTAYRDTESNVRQLQRMWIELRLP